MRQFALLLKAAVVLCPLGTLADDAPTLYTTHFFDWYKVSEQQPYENLQRAFTFRPDWEGVGLEPAEVGVSGKYYSVQFEMIRRAGFDGIHYEWFGVQPSDECVAALRETGTRAAMFYDMEIRFSKRPLFIKPTDAFLAEALADVGSFYERIPRDLWLRERDESIPLIFYGYQFDQSFRSVAEWDGFYRKLLAGLRERLGGAVRIYWTDCGALCQTYAFQHFDEISSYSFSWWGGQRQIGARSVTFVLHYDDQGAVAGGRSARTMCYDNRFIEEHLQLARLTRPRLVFNYGWNEYFEGENVFPDRTWGDWRLNTVAAIVSTLKHTPARPLPPAVILADDLYPGDLEAPGSRDAEHALLGAFRYLFPQAEARLGLRLDPLPGENPVVLAMTRKRTDDEERRLLELADAGKARVAFYEPDPAHTGPLVSRFAAGPRTRPLEQVPPPPANQWVGAEIKVDVDAAAYPFLRVRVRNSPGTFYHVRVIGLDGEGARHENHDNGSPLDWKATGGQWEDRRENMKEVLEAFAGKGIVRFVGVIAIVNATVVPGDFTAEFAEAEFADADGHVGFRVPLGDPVKVTYSSSFVNTGMPGYPVGTMEPAGASSNRLKLSLNARFASEQPLDAASQAFAFQPGVEALAWAAWPPSGSGPPQRAAVRVPLVLRKGNVFWVNTLSPHAGVYGPLMAELRMPRVRTASHLQFQQVKGITSVQKPSSATILGRDVLPVDRVRFHHPANVEAPVRYPWPATTTPLAAVRIREGVATAEPVTTVVSAMRLVVAGEAELRPGDTLDIMRVPVTVKPARGSVQVAARRETPGTYTLTLMGRGTAAVSPAAPGVRVLKDGKAVRGAVTLPCRLAVVVAQTTPSD